MTEPANPSQPPAPPTRDYAGEADRLLSAAQTARDAVSAAVLAAVDRGLAEARAGVDTCQTAILREVEGAISAARDEAERLGARVDGAINLALATAYSYAKTLGCTLPGDSDHPGILATLTAQERAGVPLSPPPSRAQQVAQLWWESLILHNGPHLGPPQYDLPPLWIDAVNDLLSHGWPTQEGFQQWLSAMMQTVGQHHSPEMPDLPDWWNRALLNPPPPPGPDGPAVPRPMPPPPLPPAPGMRGPSPPAQPLPPSVPPQTRTLQPGPAGQGPSPLTSPLSPQQQLAECLLSQTPHVGPDHPCPPDYPHVEGQVCNLICGQEHASYGGMSGVVPTVQDAAGRPTPTLPPPPGPPPVQPPPPPPPPASGQPAAELCPVAPPDCRAVVPPVDPGAPPADDDAQGRGAVLGAAQGRPDPAAPWCANLVTLRARLVAVGQALLTDHAGAGVSESQTRRFLMSLIQHGFKEWQDTSDRFAFAVEAVLDRGQLLPYLRALRDWFGQSADDRAALMALRAYLAMLAEADLSTEATGSETVDEHYDLSRKGKKGSGIELHLGVHVQVTADMEEDQGAGSKWEHRGGIATKGSIKPLVIPYLELLDALIESAGAWRVPTPADADEQFRMGFITQAEWDCYVRMHGEHPDARIATVFAGRGKTEAGDIVTLYRRGELSLEEALDRLRAIGWLYARERGEAITLSEEFPPVGDIIHFMVRNVYDQRIVEAFDLDAEFEQKYIGDLPKWGFAAGLGDKLVRAHWRSHWIIPSAGQLYTMLHRLRPEVYGEAREGLRVTSEDVDRALGENDILPFWRKRLIEISYNPPTRRDAQNFYNAGIWRETDLIRGFQDLGYTRHNAENFARWAHVRRIDWLMTRPMCRAYLAGAMGPDGLQLALRSYNVDTDEFTEIKTRLDWQLRIRTRAVCTRAVRARYLVGDVDADAALRVLMAGGWDGTRAAELVSSWECERGYRGRAIPAAQLCNWFKHGLITAAEFGTRLVRVGYSLADAQRIVGVCVSDIAAARGKLRAKAVEADTKSREKAERAATKEAAAAARARAKSAAADARAREKAASAEAKKREKEAVAAARAGSAAAREQQHQEAATARRVASEEVSRRRREDKLRRAVATYAQHASLDVPSVAGLLPQYLSQIEQSLGVDAAEAESVLIDALARSTAKNPQPLDGLVGSEIETTRVLMEEGLPVGPGGGE